MPSSRTHLLAVVAVLTALSCGAALAEDSSSPPGRVGHAIERAGEAAGHGLKRGAEATSHGLQVGAKATAHGLSRAGEAVGHAAQVAGNKVRSTLDK